MQKIPRLVEKENLGEVLGQCADVD